MTRRMPASAHILLSTDRRHVVLFDTAYQLTGCARTYQNAFKSLFENMQFRENNKYIHSTLKSTAFNCNVMDLRTL